MEGALVSAAAGALQSVLEKLASLLGVEYKRFRGVRNQIVFLTRELTAMEAFLLKMSMKEDPDVQDEVWMKEVRELSYDIEDSLDNFMVHAHDESAKPDGFMEKIKNLLGWTKDHHQIAKAIEDLKNQITETSKRNKRYRTGEVISKVNNSTIDRRDLAISSSVTAISNEKIKAEKEAAAGKKKQGAKKKQLHIEKAEDDLVARPGASYDDPDDFDFM